MRNKIFLLVFLLSLSFIPFNVSALSFTDCNNVSHEVNSQETLYHYFYYQLKSNNVTITDNNKFIMLCMGSVGYCHFYYITTTPFDSTFTISSTNRLKATDTTLFYDYIYQAIYQENGVPSPNDTPQYAVNTNSGISQSVANSTTYPYLNTEIYKSGSLFKSGNDKLSDIDTYYCPSSVEPEEPEPEEPEPEEPDTSSPISTSDFYVLLFLLSTLIWLLFFKWCFPNTKGRDLR